MNIRQQLFLIGITFCICMSCKRSENGTEKQQDSSINNQIQFAQGFQLYPHDHFTLLKISKPYPEAGKGQEFVLAKERSRIPDSLKKVPFLQIPIKKIVVTSTTHIPSLVHLNKENTLIGFPGLNYISSASVRKSIDDNKIVELGQQGQLSVELTLRQRPDVIIAHSSGQPEPQMRQLEESGIPIIFNGDWTESSPLGKAEYIKLFGALFDQSKEADDFFNNIFHQYEAAKTLVPENAKKPTVLSGAMYESVWYLPQGNSWMAVFLKDAGADYLWSGTTGTGSLALSFEAVYDKAKDADLWIGTSQFVSYKEMLAANEHYNKFNAFQHQKLFTSAAKKGATGGLLIYEEAPNRPDLVLKDLIKILHPDQLPDYTPHFFEPLQ